MWEVCCFISKTQCPQVLQDPPAQLPHPALLELPATTRPPEWAKAAVTFLEVFSPWQVSQAMGASALTIERRASKQVLQSLQKYS